MKIWPLNRQQTFLLILAQHLQYYIFIYEINVFGHFKTLRNNLTSNLACNNYN